jgi:hypothetical protein
MRYSLKIDQTVMQFRLELAQFRFKTAYEQNLALHNRSIKMLGYSIGLLIHDLKFWEVPIPA